MEDLDMDYDDVCIVSTVLQGDQDLRRELALRDSEALPLALHVDNRARVSHP